jgi:hypothetical protein
LKKCINCQITIGSKQLKAISLKCYFTRLNYRFQNSSQLIFQTCPMFSFLLVVYLGIWLFGSRPLQFFVFGETPLQFAYLEIRHYNFTSPSSCHFLRLMGVWGHRQTVFVYVYSVWTSPTLLDVSTTHHLQPQPFTIKPRAGDRPRRARPPTSTFRWAATQPHLPPPLPHLHQRLPPPLPPWRCGRSDAWGWHRSASMIWSTEV